MPRSRTTSRSREPERERRYRDRSRSRDRDMDRKHKDRSTSPYERDREKDHKRSRRMEKEEERSQSENEGVDLRDMGVKEIGEEDYFLKANEFKHWLKVEKAKYLDGMSSESAHKYFRKFVRRWNDGVLKPDQYHPPSRTKASENTGYKWSFAERGDTASNLSSIRADVQRSTHGESSSKSKSNLIGPSSSSSRNIGPSIPSASDRQYGIEIAKDIRKAERKSHLKDIYNKADELIPKSGGREGKIEERKAINDENRKFREKDITAGLEVDEGTLMGEGGSFAAALKAREQAESRRKERKDFAMQDRRAADSERLQERKAKENATMDM
nr:uncharacterized protein I206_05886 [Kwoniella pini CBS 10737]OCF48019.1 hypothetical protein I206_05886 [Kwoniella pini CBS 10737]